MVISGREIGPSEPPFCIAELSANHLGSIERYFRLMKAAKEAGAHAIKTQCYSADSLTIDCDREDFILKDGPWKGRKLYDLYSEACTPFSWHPKIYDYARELGIICFSSVFDYAAVDFLEKLGCPAYKIASMEIVDTQLISYAAKTGKPLIISTGMASPDELRDARAAVPLDQGVVFMHCISGYPSTIEEANLSRIRIYPWMESYWGLSDHTLGIEVPIAATVRGVVAIEKHFALSRADGGPDAGFSLEPHEFKSMVEATRSIWKAMQPSEAKSEEPTRQVRRSLYAVKDIEAGEVFTNENVRSIRPGYGLPPKYLPRILGRTAGRKIERGTPIMWEPPADWNSWTPEERDEILGGGGS